VHQAVSKKRPKPPMLDIPFDFKITYQVNTNFPVGIISIYAKACNLECVSHAAQMMMINNHNLLTLYLQPKLFKVIPNDLLTEMRQLPL
jgi:hypothetical protein